MHIVAGAEELAVQMLLLTYMEEDANIQDITCGASGPVKFGSVNRADTCVNPHLVTGWHWQSS